MVDWNSPTKLNSTTAQRTQQEPEMYTLVTIVDSVEDETCQTRLVGSPDLPMVVVTELMEWTLMKHLNLAGRESLALLGWECDPTPEWHNSPIAEEQCWTLNWQRLAESDPTAQEYSVKHLGAGRWEVRRPAGKQSWEVVGYLTQGVSQSWYAVRFDGEKLAIKHAAEYGGPARPHEIANTMVRWDD